MQPHAQHQEVLPDDQRERLHLQLADPSANLRRMLDHGPSESVRCRRSQPLLPGAMAQPDDKSAELFERPRLRI
jgi:hypothetical protein